MRDWTANDCCVYHARIELVLGLVDSFHYAEQRMEEGPQAGALWMACQAYR